MLSGHKQPKFNPHSPARKEVLRKGDMKVERLPPVKDMAFTQISIELFKFCGLKENFCKVP